MPPKGGKVAPCKFKFIRIIRKKVLAVGKHFFSFGKGEDLKIIMAVGGGHAHFGEPHVLPPKR